MGLSMLKGETSLFLSMNQELKPPLGEKIVQREKNSYKYFLSSLTCKTHQRKHPPHILIRKRLPLMIQQLKRSPNLRSPHPLGRIRHALPLQPLFLISKIRYHPRARGEKKYQGG